MRSRVLVAGVIAAAVIVASCGGGSSSPSRSDTSLTQPLSAHLEKAGPTPSQSAKMVCTKEARAEIAASLGIHETRITTPTWVDHLYSCTYEYPHGTITLSVKELVSAQATTAYFDRLARTLGRAQPLLGLGQGGFLSTNGDAVVRKDYKVLLVDVHAIHDDFVPLMRRSDVAQNITTAIMGCWTGA
jgi:hypothetical protein